MKKIFFFISFLVIYLSCSRYIPVEKIEKTKINKNFICENDTCRNGLILGELPIKIIFKKVRIKKNGKIFITGIAQNSKNNSPIYYLNIYLGKNINEKVLICKHLTYTDKEGYFNVKDNVDSNQFLIFSTVGYEVVIFDIKNLFSPSRPRL